MAEKEKTVTELATQKAVTEFCNVVFKKYEPALDRMMQRVETWFDGIMDEIEEEAKDHENSTT